MDDAGQRSRELWVCDLGLVPYAEAVAIQERLRVRRQAGELPDTLLLLEHPPVYTRGRRAGAQELPFGDDFYAARGIEVHATNRGGRVTYHGPGQLVGYAIMALEDVGRFLRTIEAAIVAALAREGIAAHARTADGPDFTGVWVQDRKIASIGLHVSHGVSTHGFAVNVCNDLEPFSWVVACGLPDVRMTSLARELPAGAGPSPERFRDTMAEEFARAHGRTPRVVEPAALGLEAREPATLDVEAAPTAGQVAA
jgi:lipoyl(octanoyl) transferase